MIPGRVEPFRWTPPSVVFFHRRRVARGEVVNQRPAPYAQFGGGKASVKIESRKQMGAVFLIQSEKVKQHQSVP
jgi:hypothetical protein